MIFIMFGILSYKWKYECRKFQKVVLYIHPFAIFKVHDLSDIKIPLHEATKKIYRPK